MRACSVLSIFVGQTKILVDARGEWRSSIARDRVDGLAGLEIRGFLGATGICSSFREEFFVRAR
jgi:hypothetical protein